MPFTAAHTVAVLPFVKRRKLSSTALIVGSISPDFEYFIRMDVTRGWGHDLAGIFLFDIPISVLIVFLFHRVVKNRFIDNLPAYFQLRLGHLKNLTLREDLLQRPWTFAACACLGAITHLVWDGFTHVDGYFVQSMDWLYADNYVPYDSVKYPLWYSLQYISSIAGMAVLIVYLFFMKPGQVALAKPKVWYWLSLVAFGAAAIAIRFEFPLTQPQDMYVISCITGLCLGAIVLGLLPFRKEIASRPE